MYWQSIKRVHDAFKGITARLGELTDTGYQIWQARGIAPSTFNQESYGKKTAQIENYLELIDLYEQADKGAGVMLSEEITALVCHKYGVKCFDVEQRDLVNDATTEAAEAVVKLNSKDFSKMSLNDLEETRVEVAQAAQKFKEALSILDSLIAEKKEIKSDVFNGYEKYQARAN